MRRGCPLAFFIQHRALLELLNAQATGQLFPGMLLLLSCLQVQEASELFRRYSLGGRPPPGTTASSAIAGRELPLRACRARARAHARGPSTLPHLCDPCAGELLLLPRPSSSSSSTGGARAVAAAQQLAGVSMSYQGFCAALVHVASHVAHSTPQLLDASPFLSVG